MKNLFLLFFITTSILIQGQPQQFTQTDEAINNHIFSGEWQQAKYLIEEEITKNPEHP